MNMDSERQLVPTSSKQELEAIDKLKLELVSSKQTESKRKVLDEDAFTANLESIIERDYFPDIKRYRFEIEMDRAGATKDYSKALPLLRQMAAAGGSQQPSETPAYFESPLIPQKHSTSAPPPPNEDNPKEQSSQEPASEEEVKIDGVRLNTFLNRYTSEDTDSFIQLQEETYRKNMEKFRFLANNQTDAHNEKMETAMALPSAAKQMMLKNDKDASANRLLTWKYRDINEAMFDPQGVPLTQTEKLESKSRQMICHENTRLQRDPFELRERPASIVSKRLAQVKNQLKCTKIGVDGKEILADGTPVVNGFKVLPGTPQIAPEDLPCSPLMTWGEIEATPIRLREEAATPMATPGYQFRMPDVSARDLIGHELASKIKNKNIKAQSQQSKHGRKIDGQQSSYERLTSMSPAAQLLASKKLGLGGGNIDRSLQASYTPTRHGSSSLFLTPTPRSSVITPSPGLGGKSSQALRGVVVTPKDSSKLKITKN